MPRKVKVLDGYQTLKAIRTADHPPPGEVDPSHPDAQKSAAHVHRTVVPTKQVIICYECGYSFQLHGRAKRVPCSKCRANLDLTDHVIQGKWEGPLRTAATIHIRADGAVRRADLIGKEVIIEGKVEDSRVKALQRLELRDGARFTQDQLSAPDLTIEAGAAITFADPAKFRDVELRGELSAQLEVTGKLVIRPGGALTGTLSTAHLTVEDGGGLKAQVTLRSDSPGTRREPAREELP